MTEVVQPQLQQMPYDLWRKRNNDLAQELLNGGEETEVPCPECDGEGTVECVCEECGDEHETECKKCDGSGELCDHVTERNLEEAMKAIYNEQATMDAKKLTIWEEHNTADEKTQEVQP